MMDKQQEAVRKYRVQKLWNLFVRYQQNVFFCVWYIAKSYIFIVEAIGQTFSTTCVKRMDKPK